MLREQLTYTPVELAFGTSGLRGLVTDMTDLECYINTRGFLQFLEQVGDLNGTVYVAGDLRRSTPRIMAAVLQAVTDAGQKVVNGGFVPTPGIAFAALQATSPAVMVTGSHIPDDRNGIKFYKANGEVLKQDEVGIKVAVAVIRRGQYEMSADDSIFNVDGGLRQPPKLPDIDPDIASNYLERYKKIFAPDVLKGKKVVVYQHSAVGRDILSDLIESLGAEAINVGRSDVFLPIDTENVTPADQAYFKEQAATHADCFAIISTDGDSDRPFVVDEHGIFHRGDELGAVVADALEVDFAAYPISSSDSLDSYLAGKHVPFTHTRIGSPYVIEAMQTAAADGASRVVGWEVNGGFMTGNDFTFGSGTLTKLPTRDAFFPILVALTTAAAAGQTVSALFSSLPRRYSQAGLIDNFPSDTSKSLMARFSDDSETNRQELGRYFSAEQGFGQLQRIVTLDGVRMYFEGGDIAHIRPSGNAPQLRIYSVADSQERADQIVAYARKEPDGILRQLERS